MSRFNLAQLTGDATPQAPVVPAGATVRKHHLQDDPPHDSDKAADKAARREAVRQISREVKSDKTTSIVVDACPHGVPHRWPCETCDQARAVTLKQAAQKGRRQARILDLLADGEWHTGPQLLAELKCERGYLYVALRKLTAEGVIEVIGERRSHLYRLKPNTPATINGAGPELPASPPSQCRTNTGHHSKGKADEPPPVVASKPSVAKKEPEAQQPAPASPTTRVVAGFVIERVDVVPRVNNARLAEATAALEPGESFLHDSRVYVNRIRKKHPERIFTCFVDPVTPGKWRLKRIA